MKQQKKQTKILRFYFIIGIIQTCHVTPQCPLNADKHWDSVGCDLMKNVAPYVTPYVAPHVWNKPLNATLSLAKHMFLILDTVSGLY